MALNISIIFIIIGRRNGLSPFPRQAITWTNDDLSLIETPGTRFSYFFYLQKWIWQCRLQDVYSVHMVCVKRKCHHGDYPDISKVHGANMVPTWVLPSPGGPHDGPMNLAIRVLCRQCLHRRLSCFDLQSSYMCIFNAATDMSFWLNFRKWMHWKLSKATILSLQPHG